MNVARLPSSDRWPPRRVARIGAAVVVAAAAPVVVLASVGQGARFEQVIAGLGVLAGAALVALLASLPGVSVVSRRDGAERGGPDRGR